MKPWKIVKLGCELTIPECLFLFFVLWGSGTLLSTDSSLPLYGMLISFILVILTKGILIKKYFPQIILVTSLFCVFAFIQYLFYTGVEGASIVFKIFILLLITVLFSQSSPERNIERIKYFVNLIIFFSVISNAIYLAFQFGGGITYQISSTTESMHFNYLEMVCYNALPGFEYRNGGIYWEPGMYQVYLSFALLFYLFNEKLKRRLLVIIYLTLSIISTFSITGYLVAVAIFALYSLRNNNAIIVRLLVVSVFLICLLCVLPFLSESLSTKTTTGSYDTRTNDLFLGFSLFSKHPFWGTGLGQNVFSQAYAAKFGEIRQGSNGMINLLVTFGIVGFIIVSKYIYSCIRYCKSNISSVISIPLFVWIVASANSEPIVFHPFMFLLIGIGLSYSLTNYKV